eukprot:GHVU01141117.1.p1 GENE.GHVU01141117.1~~GHVU01141117.1.p1  ORF type:complete len:127 (+),score=9.48 GHVU01141117.1:512-892(+)
MVPFPDKSQQLQLSESRQQVCRKKGGGVVRKGIMSRGASHSGRQAGFSSHRFSLLLLMVAITRRSSTRLNRFRTDAGRRSLDRPTRRGPRPPSAYLAHPTTRQTTDLSVCLSVYSFISLSPPYSRR